MKESTLRRMLGGLGNGLTAPNSWEHEGTFNLPGQEGSSRYTLRHYFHGDQKFNVWVDEELPQELFFLIMFFHRENYRGDLVSAQKEMLQHAMSSAKDYANVIMLAGYAALFTMLSQGKDFTKATSLSAGVLLALSVLCFVGLEVFGMLLRNSSNKAIARAVNDPYRFEQHISNYQESTAELARKMIPFQSAVMWIAITTALIAFLIMLSAMIDGLWLNFLSESIKAAAPPFK